MHREAARSAGLHLFSRALDFGLAVHAPALALLAPRQSTAHVFSEHRRDRAQLTDPSFEDFEECLPCLTRGTIS